MVCRWWHLKLGIELLLADSRISKGTCRLWQKGSSRSCLPILLKSKARSSKSLKIYERVSSIIRFVHNPGTLIDVHKGGRSYNEKKLMSGSVK
jgi:hypothetical protein